MAKRFYDADDLRRVKCSLSALHAELVPARRSGSGDRRIYVCPACGREGKCRVYVGTKDGSAVWSCVQCKRAGNIVDLFMVRDGLTRGEATTAVCDKWADALGSHSTVTRSPARSDRRPEAQDDLSEGTPVARLPETLDEITTPTKITDDRRREIRQYCLQAAARLWDESGRSGRDYLHMRGLDDNTIKRFRLGYDSQCRVGGSLKFGRAGIVIPYSPQLDYFAVRFIRPISGADGKFVKSMKPPVEYAGDEPLFNQGALWAGYDAVVVTEGWLDAISIAQVATTITAAKVGAVALGGADAHSKLVNALLSKPTTARLLVAMDDDDHGRAGARALSQKLDAIGQKHEVIDGSIVWGGWELPDGTPCKDANDALMSDWNDLWWLYSSILVMLEGGATITGDDLHAQDDLQPPIETGS